ncbi:hypothetical protein BTR19_15890 [Pseudomonas fluorescens]|nr:hypothetical protein CFT9_27621 [Pseudomonas sp. CFT9]OKP70206.1 hypothetical protein BTR19_15890 [Pseudomonas fluorescens]
MLHKILLMGGQALAAQRWLITPKLPDGSMAAGGGCHPNPGHSNGGIGLGRRCMAEMIKAL